MINTYNLSDSERTKYRLALHNVKTNEELINLQSRMIGNELIEGLETLPIQSTHAARATRERVERDNFQEERWKKGY